MPGAYLEWGKHEKNLSAAGAGPRNTEIILFSCKWGREEGQVAKMPYDGALQLALVWDTFRALLKPYTEAL